MYSQIGQVPPGQKPTPVLATPGKDSGERGRNAAADEDNFQTVMSAAAEASDPEQIPRERPQPDELDTSSGDTPDVEKQAGAETSDNNVEQIGDTDRIDTDEAGLESGEAASDTAEEEWTEGANASDASSDTPVAAPWAHTHIPAWFVAAPNANGAMATMQADGSSRPTPSARIGAAAVEPVSTIPADTLQPTAQTGETALSSSVAGVNPGRDPSPAKTEGEAVRSAALPAKSALSPDRINPTVSASTPAQVETTKPDRLATRHTEGDGSPLTIATQRAASPPTNTAPVAAPPMQPLTVQSEVAEDRGNIRWLSDAGFTSEIAAQDLPATSRLQQSTLLQQPDLPRNVATQLAQAMRQGGAEKPMELVLNPAELGRVRISMQSQDGAMTVQVLADRPETLDLMRRHIDVLAQEFHDIGFGTADFSFGQNSADGDGPHDNMSGHESPVIASGEPDADASPPRLSVQSDRVDIRI